VARSGSWPFAHMPVAYAGCCCTSCGARDVVAIPVHDDGEPRGPYLDGAHALLCWPCLGRDGDPLHRLR